MNDNQLTQAAQQFGVDIMIVGEAFSEGVSDAARFLPGKQTSKHLPQQVNKWVNISLSS